jgi:uncharacterized tellurite resistance protein B-like protein
MSKKAEVLDLTKIPEKDRIAFYGALFAIASIDGSLDREEINLIFEAMLLEGMSEPGKKQVYGYLLEPPDLEQSLEQLATADDTLRYGLMVNLIDVALADDVFAEEEEAAVKLAQNKLGITDEQVEEIKTFTMEVKRIRERGIDDNYALEAIKQASAGLSSVGIPIAALYFSGSVAGLSAAGITSGLATIGLGGILGLSGMVTGIGVLVVVGAGVYVGVTHLLGRGKQQAKKRHQTEQERKAQLVIQHLYTAIAALTEQIQELQGDSEANREAINVLKERLLKLQGLVKKREQMLKTIG